MLYREIVDASSRVTATAKRSEKVAIFAELLRAAPPAAAPIVVGLLVGQPRQGRIGVGWATMRDATVAGASAPSVTIGEIDRVLAAVAGTSGPGSQGERDRALHALMVRLTDGEQRHLFEVLTGGVRQGATAGVVSDAVAGLRSNCQAS